MQRENNVVMTGTYKTEQITPTFEKQAIVFASKNRDGQWQDGEFESYIKPDLIQQSGLQSGDLVKVGGFLVFNFFTKQDGTTMTFPKMIVTEIKEIEKQGGGQQAAQPTQPQAMMNTGVPGVPPAPGAAPTAPAQPQPQMEAAQAFGAPPVPPVPGVPPAA